MQRNLAATNEIPGDEQLQNWREVAEAEATFDESTLVPQLKVELDQDLALQFLANFFAAGIALNYEESPQPLPKAGSGELEKAVISYLGNLGKSIKAGEDYERYHDVWDISAERQNGKYSITIMPNTFREKDFKRAYELCMEKDLVDYTLIEDWDLGSYYEKIDSQEF